LTSKGVKNATDVAMSAVAHWDVETAGGAHEYNYNVGGINASQGQQYFKSTDVGSPTVPVAFCAYNTIEEGIADYFAVLSISRFAGCLEKLLTDPTSDDWIRCLGSAGYYDSKNTNTMASAWKTRRDALSKLLASSPSSPAPPPPTTPPKTEPPPTTPKPTPTKWEPGTYETTGTQINIRKGPSKNEPVLGMTGHAGALFEANGQIQDGFALGLFKTPGWIASQYVKNDTVTGSNVNVRSKPVVDGSKMPGEGNIIAQTGIAGAKFIADGHTEGVFSRGVYEQVGWMHTDYLKRAAGGHHK
jgi:hypothetical protein